MKKLLLLAIGLMVIGTSCSREVYINKQKEVIREKERTSDTRIIDRDKSVYERDRETQGTGGSTDRPSGRPGNTGTESDYQTIVD